MRKAGEFTGTLLLPLTCVRRLVRFCGVTVVSAPERVMALAVGTVRNGPWGELLFFGFVRLSMVALSLFTISSRILLIINSRIAPAD